MQWISLVGGSIMGAMHSILSFYAPIKESKYYYIIGIVVSVISTTTWLWIARSTDVKEDIYRYGMMWDSMILLTWYVGSILVFNLRFPLISWVGIGLFIAGVLVTKATGN